ncbi:MAG: dTDP-glucose 4,6-dehydratase [Candidatus Latescibacteria bacterium]|nr:dTDP-glucose 4,6-dehydratase [Candidatus Latescibacterota bacterium]
MKTWVVTGGAGFIGSNFVQRHRMLKSARIINLDKLSYAGNIGNINNLFEDPDHIFIHGDINDRILVHDILTKYHPDAVIHFAAETHVDRSIIGPEAFITTNIAGTFSLLDEVRNYWNNLDPGLKDTFRFHHISTDEVYGSLGPDDAPFTEFSRYEPNSPYSASKASGDHLVRSYFTTYGLPVLITNCSNNYGPFQFPEKLIPLMILNALDGKVLPVYGDGKNIRDWLYVMDHVNAIYLVLEQGNVGETYNIGGSCQKTNIEVVQTICEILDQLFPNSHNKPHASLITFVKDRPGHDRRYAIDSSKIKHKLGWKPAETFETGMEKTILWYIENTKWIQSVKSGAYRDWIDINYEKR